SHCFRPPRHLHSFPTRRSSDLTNRLAAIAKALAHPARVAILEVLIRRQACVCGDIVDELPLAQSTISQHLKELKQAGLIQGDIRSEEHTSELQSREKLVCRLLL